MEAIERNNVYLAQGYLHLSSEHPPTPYNIAMEELKRQSVVTTFAVENAAKSCSLDGVLRGGRT